MKIIFLHGLESNNKSSKVTSMLNNGCQVHAPEMQYHSNLNLYSETLNFVLDYKPELIVGSSMGGYFAFHLGTHFKTNLLLLNPALHGRSFDPPIIKDGAEESRIWALVGKNDTVIDPVKNTQILNNFGSTVKLGDHGHRTPLDVFEPFFVEVIDIMRSGHN
jgi:predicted esterase YcpF (UPF0227 family)